MKSSISSQIADAEKSLYQSQDSTVSSPAQQQQQQPSTPGAIHLSVEEQHSGYRWINAISGVINPTVSFNVGTARTIQLQNPKDSKHQLVIDDPNGNYYITITNSLLEC